MLSGAAVPQARSRTPRSWTKTTSRPSNVSLSDPALYVPHATQRPTLTPYDRAPCRSPQSRSCSPAQVRSAASTTPLYASTGLTPGAARTEIDHTFPLAARRRAEDILVERRATYFIQVFSGVSHGFALRGNMAVPVEREWAPLGLVDGR